MKNPKIFLIKIVTLNKFKEWNYEPNTEIIIPVQTNSSYNALKKFDNKCWGSEYPDFKILSVTECDKHLFQPILL